MARICYSIALGAMALISAPLQGQEGEKAPIRFTVRLPEKATLMVGEYQTTSKGASRLFESPAMATGKRYTYTLKATLNGKVVEKQVVLSSSTENVFDLTADFQSTGGGTGTGTALEDFATFERDGRLWVYRKGSKELEDFKKNGPSDKHATRINVGPKGMTVKAPDDATLVEYLVSKNGFKTIVKEGRVWIFKAGSPQWDEYQNQGPPEKHVTRINAGPLGMTIKAPTTETLDAYLKEEK